MPKVLVTGGAGYIGSHTLVELLNDGYDVLSIDNYLNSDPITYRLVREITGRDFPVYEVDLRDARETLRVFEEHPDLDAVIHFAALKSVPDSVANPTFCLDNNNNALLSITEACLNQGVRDFIFSSSCSVYGNVLKEDLPVTEKTPLKRAESPYAYSKQNGEVLLEFTTAVRDLRAVCLRYFNPVGAHISGELGELPAKRVNNLVPVITQAAAGVIPSFDVFGTDWDTRDGSCVRDYIHVSDIARAHVMALDVLQEEGASAFDIINLGSGEGVSVLEAIHAFEEATDVQSPHRLADRRAGDVESIYTDPQKAADVLNWKPQFSLRDMMASAWAWQQKLAKLGLAKHKL